ncbi:MAG TPA: hypothetical protein VNA69_09350 [Thermoanaerobaculia bacterium]|nr:hypothetical protein [Thermoanaerobaculia bacterium]
MILLLLFTLPLFADNFSYVYSRAEGSATISRGSLKEVLRLKERFTGTYLWARLDGREYLIRDAAALAQVRTAFVPMEALRPPQRALHAKMRPIERRVDRLEREIDSITDRDDDEELTDADRERLHVLKRDLREARRELRVYEDEERKLDEREEVLEKVFDAEIERIVKQAVRRGVAERVR